MLLLPGGVTLRWRSIGHRLRSISPLCYGLPIQLIQSMCVVTLSGFKLQTSCYFQKTAVYA